ncbi:MAG: TonB family protein / TonB-dependent receptor [Myxococcaceae bacterium]|nr:TonB family protein / TonB-dependent receptor [Myxococcaceae bacterium]
MRRPNETATGPELAKGREARRGIRALALKLGLFFALIPVLTATLAAQAQPQASPTPGSPASADGSPVSAPPFDPNAVTPPKLLAFVDAGYPEQARAMQRDAAVLLVITIGADGFVEEAKLAGEPVGDGFDELAVSAARRFVFEPASKGGVPMRSRVQYNYEFKYQPAPAVLTKPAAHAPLEARVRVTVHSGENDKPLAGVEVLLTNDENPTFAERLITDEQGVVSAHGLLPGRYGFALSRKDLTPERNVEELPEGETTELIYRLLPAMEAGDEYGAVAVLKAPAREVTRRTIERDVLTRVAGTRGDALRAIELLPGVGRPPFTAGQILIRGAGPSDSQVFLDGVPVPLLYHFGGLTSFINSRALDRIDFYPGNFSVRFGRATGGIVDVGVRDPTADKIHGVLDINVPLDSSLLLEGPITDKASFMVAGRRSYFGSIASAAIPAGALGAFPAPVYSDFQAFVTYRPTDRDKLRMGFYGDSDRLKILFAKNNDDPTIKSLQFGTSFQRAQLGWKRQYSTKLEHDIQLALGRESTVVNVPPSFDLSIKTQTAYLRAEWRYRMSESAQLIVGTDSTMQLYSASYDGPTPSAGDDSSNGGAPDSMPAAGFHKKNLTYSPSAFIELALMPFKQLRIVPGLRLDYFQLTGRYSFDPRVAAIYSLSDSTRLKAGVGVFSQPPQPPYSLPGIGNPALLWTKAIHYSVGVEHSFNDDYSLNLEGFYKNLYDNVVGTDFAAAAAKGITNPPPFDNNGIGRIYGLEVLGRKQAKGRWFGFVSYTLMRSERKDHHQAWRVYNYDQTHILSLACGVKIGRGWEGGATFRVVTGNPYTPIAGASLDQDTGGYNSTDGKPNSARNPTFNRLDLRVEKTWRFDAWRLALYLDVQNSYNAVNREAVQYSYNYRQTATVRGLPIIPVLGLRGEL